MARARRIAAASSGFVYVVSRTGVTGAGESLSESVRQLVTDLRSVTEKPLAVGFGVSTPAHAAEVGRYADGVVVGSALIDRMAHARAGEEEAAARDFCSSLAAALRVGGDGSRESAGSS
jgi:tryptophan synthase alpha chain